MEHIAKNSQKVFLWKNVDSQVVDAPEILYFDIFNPVHGGVLFGWSFATCLFLFVLCGDTMYPKYIY